MFFSKFVQFISPKSKFVKKDPSLREAGHDADDGAVPPSGGERHYLTPEYFNASTCTRIAQKCALTGLTDIGVAIEPPLAQPNFREYVESGCVVHYQKGWHKFSATFGVSREVNGLTYRLRGEITNHTGMPKTVVVRNGLTYEEVERTIVNALLASPRNEGEIGTQPN